MVNLLYMYTYILRMYVQMEMTIISDITLNALSVWLDNAGQVPAGPVAQHAIVKRSRAQAMADDSQEGFAWKHSKRSVKKAFDEKRLQEAKLEADRVKQQKLEDKAKQKTDKEHARQLELLHKMQARSATKQQEVLDKMQARFEIKCAAAEATQLCAAQAEPASEDERANERQWLVQSAHKKHMQLREQEALEATQLCAATQMHDELFQPTQETCAATQMDDDIPQPATPVRAQNATTPEQQYGATPGSSTPEKHSEPPSTLRGNMLAAEATAEAQQGSEVELDEEAHKIRMWQDTSSISLN